MDYKCKATKRNGKPCRQTKDLDTDGYCKYHQSSKFKTGSSTQTAPPKPTATPTPPSVPSMKQFLALEKIVKELSIHIAEMSSKLVEQSGLIDELQDRLEEDVIPNGYTEDAELDP